MLKSMFLVIFFTSVNVFAALEPGKKYEFEAEGMKGTCTFVRMQGSEAVVKDLKVGIMNVQMEVAMPAGALGKCVGSVKSSTEKVAEVSNDDGSNSAQ